MKNKHYPLISNYTKNNKYINKVVVINDKEWKISERVKRYGIEWQYILVREKVDGTYQSMSLNEEALSTLMNIVLE